MAEKEKETRIMKVTMSKEEFRKFDQGITYSSGGVRRIKDGKLSALPDIAPVDPKEIAPKTKSSEEIQLQRRKIEMLAKAERSDRQLEALQEIGSILHGIAYITSVLADHPEIIRSGQKFGRKVRDTAKTGYSKLRARAKKQPLKAQTEIIVDNPGETICEVELVGEDQERIVISEEQAKQLLANMREEAKKLVAMMYLWSVITIKDEKTETEYTLEQSYIKELLSDDVHSTIEFLVAHRNLLDKSTAQTLSEFLDGYLTAEGRRIPIPVLIGDSNDAKREEAASMIE